MLPHVTPKLMISKPVTKKWVDELLFIFLSQMF